MTGSEQSSWSIVSVPSPDLARTGSGAAPVEHSDWVRLFMGASFARCRMGSGSGAVAEYLVSGLRLSDAGPLDDSTSAEVAAALGQAFDGLRDVLAFHRKRIDEAQRRAERGGDVPYELLLTTYPMLMCVTVSDDPDDWVVTDEGLCIVRWGLRSPRMRPLLQWTDAELQAMRASVFLQSRLRLVEPGSGSTPANEVVRGSWYAVGAAESPQPASGAPKQQAAGTSGRSAVPKSTAGVTIAVRSRPRSKALDWAFRVAVVGLAVVVGFVCGRTIGGSSKGPSQQEQQRSSGSLPMAAHQSSGSLESAPAAQLAGATASSREIEELRKQKDDVDKKLVEVTAERDDFQSKLKAATAGSAEWEQERSKAARNAATLRDQIKNFKQERLESKATQFALAISLVEGKPPAAGATEVRPEFRGVLSAISILQSQWMAAIDVPLASGWSNELSDTLREYRAIEVPDRDAGADVLRGFYWCRTSDLPKLSRVAQPVDLFNNKGLRKWNRNNRSPIAKEVADCPLMELGKEIPGTSSSASVRDLWRWMNKFDSRVVSDPPEPPLGDAADSIEALRLPEDLWKSLVSEALNSVEKQLKSLSERDPKPHGADDALESLRRAKENWKPESRATNEDLQSQWKKVKSELKTWSADTASNPEIVFYGVLSVEDGVAEAWGYPMSPLSGAVRPQQGTLYAVNDGKPKQIGDVKDGKPSRNSSDTLKLDGCPVICVSTSPGAKGPAAADPSK